MDGQDLEYALFSRAEMARRYALGLAPGAEFTFTFDRPGAWGYHCSAHFNRGMIAQVVVR